jgi:hypothetical protein
MTAQEIAGKLALLGCNATPAAPGTIDLIDLNLLTEHECTIFSEEPPTDEYVNAQQVAYIMKLGVGFQMAVSTGGRNDLCEVL